VVRRRKIDDDRAADPIRKLYRTPLWRSTRREILARDPFCEMCQQALSTIVHHIIAARKYINQHGGDESSFYDQENLQGVCKPCHDQHTAKECGFAPGQ
jgi:5-methylcytosine-specific restriction protein A